MKRPVFYFMFIIFFFCLDQVSKALIVRQLAHNGSIKVIPGILTFVHVHNRGTIFGFFSQTHNPLTSLVLTLTSMAALSLVVYYFFKTQPSEKLLKIALSLILAGALGNLADRILRGYVIDFLDFSIRRWHWPTFNLADSCITIGAFFLLYAYFFQKGPKCSPS